MENISFIYYFNFILLAGLAIFNRKSSKGLQYVVFLYMSILVAIRYNVGIDYVNYVRLFNETSLSTLFDDLLQIEYGAFGSMAIIKAIGLDVPWWFFFMSMMTMITLFKGIERFGYNNIWWALLIYYSAFFFTNQCNLMQHGAMVGWVWLAFSYIDEKNLKKFLIFILLGISFHVLALFFVPFYWILRKEIAFPYMVLILFSSVIFNLYLLNYFFDILKIGYIGYKIELYQEVFFKDQEVEKKISLGMIVYAMLLLGLYVFKFNGANSNFTLLRNALLFSLFFQVGFKGTGIFDARIGGLLNISLLILVPFFFKSISKQYTKLLMPVMLLYSFVMFVTNATTKTELYDSGYQFIPYKTIINK